MAEHATKDRILRAVEELPDDVTLEEAIEKLCFLAKVERGLKQANEGKTIPPRRSQGTLARVTKLLWTTQAVEDVEARTDVG